MIGFVSRLRLCSWSVVEPAETWLCKVSKIGLSLFSVSFGKSKSRLFSASVLVSVKYFLVSAVVWFKVKFVFFQQAFRLIIAFGYSWF